MADIETLGVRVEGSGIEETKAQLLSLGDAGEQGAARASSAASAAATEFSQVFAESAARTRQVVETQLNTLTSLAASYGTSSAEARDQAQRLAQAIEDGGRMASASAAQIKQLADAKAAMAGADSQAAASEQRVSFALRDAATVTDRQSAALRSLITAESAAYGVEEQRTAATRRMALAQSEAIAIEEARNATAAGSVSKFAQLTAAYDNSNGGIGRLRQGFVSLASQMTGTNAVVDRTITTLGGLAIGNTLVLGLVVAVAAAGYAYEKLTEDTRKAKEEQDRLTASLGKWYDEQRLGPTGEIERQIGAEIKALRDMRTALDETLNHRTLSDLPEFLKAIGNAFVIHNTFDPRAATTEFERLWNQYVQGQKAAIVKGAEEIKAAARQAYENTITATQDFYTTQTSQLSGLASGGAATPGQLAQLTQNVTTYRNALSELQREYGTLADAGKRAFNLQQQASAFSNLTSAEDALRNNLLKPLKDIQDEQALAIESTNAYTAANKTALDAIDKQGDALRKSAQEQNDLAVATEQAARLAGLDGVARELVTARIKAENEQRKANRDLIGSDLDAATREIQSNYDSAKSAILHTAAIKDQAEAQKFLGAAVKDADAIAAKNTKTAHEQLTEGLKLYQESNAAAQHLAQTLEKDLLRSVEQLTTGGISSFSSFFKVVEDGAIRMTEAVQQSLATQQKLFSQAIAANQTADAADIASRIENLKKLQEVTGGIGAAVGGATAGFNLGQQTSSGFNGAGVGGLAGAATGYELAGPFGAVIGGFTGVIGGLLGAAQAHREAAKAIEDASKQLATNIASYTSGSSVASALADNQAKHDALILQAQQLAGQRFGQAANDRSRSEADAAYAGLQADTAAINAAQGANAVRIANDFWAGITAGLNTLRGPAGALDNELASLTKTYTDNLAAAAALHGPTDDITKLYTEQVAAAKAAYAEGQQQLRFSEDAREDYAKGLTAEGDAITRRAAEEKELFDDEQAGYTDVQLARVRYIQGLEDAAAAQKKAADAAKALADAYTSLATSQAAGPNGTLASQQAAALQPLLDKQTADLATYAAAAAQYSSDIANGADPIKTTTDYFAALTAGITLAGDQAAIAAKQWQDAQAAIAQANTDIANAVQGGHISGASGLAAEAQNFGFTGLSDAQINALYTDPTKGDLTNEQRQTNQNIDQYLADEKRWGQQLADAITSTSAANPKPSDAVSYAARNLSEVTGNRMADYLSSILTVEREQLDFWKGGGAGQVSRIVADQQRFYNALSATPLPNFTNAAPLAFPTAPSAPASAQTAPRAVAPPPSGPTTVTLNINVRVNADGKIDRSELPQLGEDIAEFVEEALARRAQQQRLADGSPLLAGR